MALPFHLRTEGFRDNPDRLAFLHGPLVLAAQTDVYQAMPAIVADADRMVASLKPVAGKASTFTGSPDVFRIPGQSAGHEITLEPFYKIHGNRHYVVYWDRLTASQWKHREAEYAADLARMKELDRRTVDQVKPGEEQNERDHGFEGEKSSAGNFENRGWRDAHDGGHFRYALKVLPHQPQELSVTYWGGDRGRRVFDVLVEGEKVATETLENNRPGRFYDQSYPLPENVTKGKSHVTVTFQAHPQHTAGGVFEVRVLMSK